MNQWVIETEGLTKVYRMGASEIHALSGVSLRVAAGEFVALMGASGSGKSTLLHLLGCLDTPTAGRYHLESQEVGSLSGEARSRVRSTRIGFVFQTFNLLPRLDALENVVLPLLYQGHAQQTEQRAQEALQRVGLAHRARHRPMELSGGERQRVAIARALVTGPSIILADEPTGNLDTATGAEVMNLLAGLHAEGRTILMVTHNPQVAGHAQRTLFMQDGVIRNGRGDDVPC